MKTYPDGGKFWKGQVPPSSTAKISAEAQARMNRDLNARKVKIEGGVRAEDGSIVPKSYYAKSTGIARAQSVASPNARGLMSKVPGMVAKKAVGVVKSVVRNSPMGSAYRGMKKTFGR